MNCARVGLLGMVLVALAFVFLPRFQRISLHHFQHKSLHFSTPHLGLLNLMHRQKLNLMNSRVCLLCFCSVIQQRIPGDHPSSPTRMHSGYAGKAGNFWVMGIRIILQNKNYPHQIKQDGAIKVTVLDGEGTESIIIRMITFDKDRIFRWGWHWGMRNTTFRIPNSSHSWQDSQSKKRTGGPRQLGKLWTLW